MSGAIAPELKHYWRSSPRFLAYCRATGKDVEKALGEPRARIVFGDWTLVHWVEFRALDRMPVLSREEENAFTEWLAREKYPEGYRAPISAARDKAKQNELEPTAKQRELFG